MAEELWIKIEADQTPTIIATGGEENLTLKDMQGAVGGLIEYCTFGHNVQFPVPQTNGAGFVMATVLDVIANEEGRLVAEPEINPIGTYCAFGIPIFEAPYMIVGDVLIHVKIEDDAQRCTANDIIKLIMGMTEPQTSHMMPNPALYEADYGVDEQ